MGGSPRIREACRDLNGGSGPYRFNEGLVAAVCISPGTSATCQPRVIFSITGGYFQVFLFLKEFFIVRVTRYTLETGLRREDLARSAGLGLIVIVADRCSL